MASEARLYSFSPFTRLILKKFQLSQRGDDDRVRARIFLITDSCEIRAEQPPDDSGDGKILNATKGVYTDLDSLAEKLDETTQPRFVMYSYPVRGSGGGLKKVRYVMLYYMPVGVKTELRMVYAGAKELLRTTSGAQSVIDVADEEDIRELKELLEEED